MTHTTKSSAQRRKAGGDQRIARGDWVRAGLVLLSRQGIDAVRVEPLAEQLKVTKGSFYWHFVDRAALHTAMLGTWQHAATGDIIKIVEAETPDARHRLFRLIELATSDGRAAGLETAIRAWAQHDPAAGKVLADVDAARLQYVANLLRETGMASSVAATRAKILYLVLIGSFFAGSKTDLHAGPELWSEITKLIA